MRPQNLSSKLWAMALLLLGLTTLSQAQVLQNLPRLKVEGPYMVDPQGNRVALRGVNVTASPQQQYWDMGGEVATVKESIRRATENNRNGANLSSTLIRFAMYPNRWGQRCCNKPGENNTQKWTPAFQAEFEEYVDNKLDQYVQYCKQRGVYILIDMHYISDANPVIKTSLMNYWPYLAKKYKDSDWVLFGLFNEPIRVYDGNKWSYDWLSFRNWAQPVVDEIRNHSENIVMVGGLSWSKIFNEGTVTSVINRPIQGGNIVYDYHVYSPFYCKNGGQLNVQRLNQTIGETITKYPVLYGEFGWYGEPGCVAGHSGTCQSYGQPLKEWTDNPSRRQKISWTPWSYSHQSGPTMLTSDGQLTDCNAHGTFIRDWLWERRNSDNPCVNCQPAATKQTAYQGPHNIPGNLEGEHYDNGGQGVAYNDDNSRDGDQLFRPGDKVDVGSKATASNGYSIGWSNPGEWVEYTIDTIMAGTYNIVFSHTSGSSNPGALEVSLDGDVIATFEDIANTGGWNSFTTDTVKSISLGPDGNKILRLKYVNGAGFDIDAISFEALSTQQAYQGPHTLPGTIEAEYYDTGGEGIAYHDDGSRTGDLTFRPDEKVDVGNKAAASNGYSVGWTAEGEWLEYTVDNVTAGTYDIILTYASGSSAPGELKVTLDDVTLGTFTSLTNSGGWESFTTIRVTDVDIAAGSNKVLKLAFVNGAGFDLDALEFVAATPVPQVGQTIWLQTKTTGKYVYRSSNDGKLYASGSGTTDESKKEFHLLDAGSGYVYLQNPVSGQYVRALTYAGEQLDAQGGNNDKARWKIQDANNGYIVLENKYFAGQHMRSNENVANKSVDCYGGTGGWAQFSWGISSTGGRQMTQGIEKQKLTNFEGPSDRQINVYPNPGGGVYQLKLGESTKVRVMDMTGRVVYEHRHHSGESSLNLSSLGKGLYVLVVKNQQFKLIKE